MCGRYVITKSAEAIRRLFGTTSPLVNYPPSYNVAPTDSVPAVRFNPETKQRSLDLLRWGLIPFWAKDMKLGASMINARAETLATKPAFREAFERRRCLIPADAFYEWKKTPSGKQPYAIGLKSGEPMAFAGLWERWKSPADEIVRSCTIVTGEPNELVATLHDRMPVILGADDWPMWLGEREGNLAQLLRPYDAAAMKIWPVSTKVNSVKNNAPELIEALAT